MKGVSLKISLSRCWFCIGCHFPISILFRPGKACWYCVTKGIRSFLRERICFSAVGHFLFPSSCPLHSFIASRKTPCSPCLAQTPVMQANFFLVWITLYNSAEEDSKLETGPENGLFWLRRVDQYSTTSTILNFQCETTREVSLGEMGSMLNLDTFSWH